MQLFTSSPPTPSVYPPSHLPFLGYCNSLYVSSHHPHIRRCLFASNFPVDRVNGSFSKLINTLNTVLEPFSESEKNKFYAANALKFYRL